MTATARRFACLGIAIVCASPLAHAQNVKVDEQQSTGATQGVLASAKDLYAAASYEAALLELNGGVKAGGEEDLDQIDTYRALCQLALDRPQDAEQTLVQIVARKPMYAISDSQYSPRLVAMFRDVRKRALPGSVQQLYIAAKANYADKDYAAASAKFTLLLSVLDDPDISHQDAALSDLRELADGFLKLSQQRIAESAQARVATPSAASTPAPAAAAASAVPASYNSLDAGIKPPVVISQVMPAWKPTQSQSVNNRTIIGRLEVVIDEQGAVESVILLKSLWPTYDPLLLEAAKNWRYQPALKNGQPVKFAKVLEITIK